MLGHDRQGLWSLTGAWRGLSGACRLFDNIVETFYYVGLKHITPDQVFSSFYVEGQWGDCRQVVGNLGFLDLCTCMLLAATN